MISPAPVYVADRFPALRERLVGLLRGLTEEEWLLPTAAPLWSVKDVAAHLLGGDVGILSRRRDGFMAPGNPISGYAELASLIHRLNREWVLAASRMSSRVLCELLDFTGPAVEAYFASLDPDAAGGPVEWVGPDPAPVWLDMAREFTERWHHQQQIRDATNRPALYEPHFFEPVLSTFIRVLPFAYRDSAAPEGTVIDVGISGEAGGAWSLLRTAGAWKLRVRDGGQSNQQAVSGVTIPQDVAWRLFTRGMTGESAHQLSSVRGDPAFVAPLFSAVAVIA